ncbi:dihydroneopterin aldolase [Blastomyces parvus]|uniref:dihydroneopterin aldolase n=1 Tax=Blastomyces parvus TaxID=2060905 RepID=A0A2B7WGP4_9EURO|nr:dihydroneopterin aldolase [Blastomyces parvus]
MAPSGFDTIVLRDIAFPFPISFGPDAWGRLNKPQPATLSLRFSYPRPLIDRCGSSDDVSFTLSYGDLYRKLEVELRAATRGEDGNISSVDLEELASTISKTALKLAWETIPEGTVEVPSAMAGAEIDISIHLPKAILGAEKGLTYQAVNRAGNPHVSPVANPDGQRETTTTVQGICRIFRIDGLRCNCIIGVNPHERQAKQAVVVSLEFPKANADFHPQVNVLLPLVGITRHITAAIENSSFKTVEAMAQLVAKLAIEGTNFDEVTVCVEKPSAMAFVGYSGVEITRTRRDLLSSNNG